MEIKNFAPRSYQESILKTALEKNTLVVLPTGMGKTAISFLLAVERLKKYPDSKIIIVSPTKPLSAQHLKTFKDHTDIQEVVLLTGATAPEKRKKIFEESKIITATPQTIQSDIKNNRIYLEKAIKQANGKVGIIVFSSGAESLYKFNPKLFEFISFLKIISPMFSTDVLNMRLPDIGTRAIRNIAGITTTEEYILSVKGLIDYLNSQGIPVSLSLGTRDKILNSLKIASIFHDQLGITAELQDRGHAPTPQQIIRINNHYSLQE